jgi:hypothetical protein
MFVAKSFIERLVNIFSKYLYVWLEKYLYVWLDNPYKIYKTLDLKAQHLIREYPVDGYMDAPRIIVAGAHSGVARFFISSFLFAWYLRLLFIEEYLNLKPEE